MSTLNFYCPRSTCCMHKKPTQNFFNKNGSYFENEIKIQRYKCKNCSKTFNAKHLKLDYRCRRKNIYEDIFHCSTQGMSNRAIARKLGMAESSIRNRLKHLSRQALLRWEQLQRPHKIQEDVCYDGFETFVYSQYDPNNINHAVGKKSFFLYDFNYSHINRKGRMTSAQRKRLRDIQQKNGRYPQNLIYTQSKKIFSYIDLKKENRLTLYTDEHFSYTKALNTLNLSKINHHQTNSKDHRGVNNHLFPINHLDMKLRHFLKSCTRETIAFNKNEMGLMDRYILHGVQKNFLRPRFLKHGKNKEEKSPAMLIEILDKIMTFSEFFNVRKTSLQINLREEWRNYYRRISEHSRFYTREYMGA